mmetsp:Transcript_1946/g.3632  ORF Transcript_1946/g.3632 Transcript_1946/m.3632 type:complete len:200 (-) Transcript_1946:140-739(-)
MPTKVFDVDEVLIGDALLKEVRLGFNLHAGSLNLLVPGSKTGAIAVDSGYGKGVRPELEVDGSSCKVGRALKACFSNAHAAAEFARFLEPDELKWKAVERGKARPKLFFGELQKAAFVDDLADTGSLFDDSCGTVEDLELPAPSTPPRRASVRLAETPPRIKRPKLLTAEETPPRLKRPKLRLADVGEKVVTDNGCLLR